MGHISKAVAVVVSLSWILSCTLIAASPVDVAGAIAPSPTEISRMNNVPRGLDKREDEDDDSVDINADGTGPIRSGMICILIHQAQSLRGTADMQ